MIDPYNSMVAEKRIQADVEKMIQNSSFLMDLRRELQMILDVGKFYGMEMRELWDK